MKQMMLLLAFGGGLAGCTMAQTDGNRFFNHLKSFCGATLDGTVIRSDPQDIDWRSATLALEVAPCQLREVEMQLAKGQDRSRTWIVSSFADSLALRHRHMHEDGAEDNVSGYGGMADLNGSEFVQFFPADRYSQNLFDRENIPESKTNVWTLTLDPQTRTITYALNRPGREFVVIFEASDR
jgi:hypothetical protein